MLKDPTLYYITTTVTQRQTRQTPAPPRKPSTPFNHQLKCWTCLAEKIEIMNFVLYLLPLLFSCIGASNNCLQSTTSVEYSLCQFCSTTTSAATARFSLFLSPAVLKDLCGAKTAPPSTTIAQALVSYGQIQGYFWEDTNATETALAHLIQYMPVKDAIRLYQNNDIFLEFLLKHVRFALLVRTKTGGSWARNRSLVSDALFLDYVLPYR
jgi:hypothetical protein